MRQYSLIALLGILLVGCEWKESPQVDEIYFFNRPAEIWEETLPLGNGRIGMMPDGGIERESWVLNEISLWSGSEQVTDNPYAYYALSSIRHLLFTGRNDEAQKLMYRSFVCAGKGSNMGDGANAPYGSYQLFGRLEAQFQYGGVGDSVRGYRRELNLRNALATTSFTRRKVKYERHSFTSFADDVGVIHLVSDMDQMLSFDLAFNRPEHSQTRIDGYDLLMEGQLPDGVDTLACRGMRFAGRVRVLLPKGGHLMRSDTSLMVRDASEVLLLVSLGTDYWNKNTFEQEIKDKLDRAARKNYAALLRDHLAAYQEKYNRVRLELPAAGRTDWPIDQRLAAFHTRKDDPSLIALYFQFGRYLLISSTRPGSLPPNLQGLWANTIHTPWNGDYHLNINLQMNHWPAEVANLSELHLPLTDWILSQIPSGERTAKSFYNARGWVTHILGNVWGFTAPGEHPSWGATNTSAAWLCAHLYQHFQFTRDTAYLRRAYPAMRGAALFFVDMLVKDPRLGYYVTAPTTSPENAYKMANDSVVSICAGSTMDNQILRELFTNTIEAAQILHEDSALIPELARLRAGLMPTRIGPDGRVMEWLEPYQEVEPTHRHVSHLYGLYPGDEITVDGTPDLAEAARQTLLARGDESTGWSMAWKINFWARLRDGDHAYKLLTDLLAPAIDPSTGEATRGGTYPNLFCAHPPFQIDGNFGGTAGVAEMLLQSHGPCIELLPALPSAWHSGRYSGLRTRGGGVVSVEWHEGRVVECALRAEIDGTFRLRLPEPNGNIRLELDSRPISLPIVDGTLTVTLKAGETLRASF